MSSIDNNIYKIDEDKIKYSKVLSSLFSSTAIISFSMLCLLNNFSIDFYSMMTLLKVVIPAAICFWFIGYIIGKILDRFDKKIVIKKISDEKKAYEIPSMFSASPDIQEETEEL